MTTPTTSLTCEADTSGRYATRAHACGLPATIAFRTTTHDGKERIEARCAKHAGIIKRTRWPGGTLVDLTPEVVDAITARVVEAKARRDAERAAKREADAIRTEAARVEAHELDAVAWSPVRADEQTLDGWDGAAPIYRDVPRWEIRREDGVGWDTATVKVDRRAEGWPAEITLSAPSRLTRRQANRARRGAPGRRRRGRHRLRRVRGWQRVGRLREMRTPARGPHRLTPKPGDRPVRRRPRPALTRQGTHQEHPMATKKDTSTETPASGMRRCIGSTAFGIEAHEAPVDDFPVQASAKDGLGRMCRAHWTAYTRALRKASVARKAEVEVAPEPIAEREAATPRKGRRAKAAPEPEAHAA